MILIPLIVNAIVIFVIGAELVATALGMASADQLLVASTLSGLLTILSFRLSKEALLRINGDSDSLSSVDEKVADEA